MRCLFTCKNHTDQQIGPERQFPVWCNSANIKCTKKSEHTENCRREGSHINVSESSMEALKIIMLRLIFVHVLKKHR